MRARAKRLAFRIVAGLGLAVVVAAAVAAIGLLHLYTGAAPPAAGALRVAGLEAPARILRDSFGIPHIEAATEADAFLALGLAHAQDRLWQMETLRRTASGRLSELFGETTIERDRLARTLGFRAAADAEVDRLPAGTRRLLAAYASGVNRWIEEVREGRAPLPFELGWLGVDLEEWAEADSLAIVRLRAWALGRSLSATLLLDRLVRAHGGLKAQQLFPVQPSPGEAEAVSHLLGIGRTADRLAGAAALAGPVGSLGFVVGPSRSASGRPLLANDPHVEFGLPAGFYLAHLEAGDLAISGGTWPGVPVFWLGTNRRIAWGQVALRLSTSDLYHETLHPSDRQKYDRGGRWQRVSLRSERIRLRSGRLEELEVRTTRHGPLLSALETGDASVASYAVRWTGQAEVSGTGSLLALQRAADWEAFREALRSYPAPAASFLYADDSGQIGRQVAGDLPIRAIETGLLPVPGRSRYYDWRGFVPFDELPSQVGDDLPWLVAAPRLEDEGLDPPVTWLWAPGDGAARLRILLEDDTRISLQDVIAIQRETRSHSGPKALEVLLRDTEDVDGLAARVRRILADWDGDTGPDSRGASLYHVFRQRLTGRLLQERFGDRREILDQIRAAEPVPGTVLARFLDRVGPEQGREQIVEALEETWVWLGIHVSSNPGRWTWGELHGLRLRHPFEIMGGPVERWLGRLLGRGPHAVGGDPDSVWSMYHAELPSAESRVGPALRYAIDLADPDHAQAGLAGGQSGHPSSAAYDDGLHAWLAGRPRPLWMHWPDIEHFSRGEWALTPAPRSAE